MRRILRHDDFYGLLQSRATVPGFTLAHRLAAGPPESVETHTHLDAHFVFVTSGRYLSSARGKPDGRLPLIYNPPGTTHRDRFQQGRGSFFTVSVSDGLLHDATLGAPQSFASVLTDRRSRGLASTLLWELTHGCDGTAHIESLALELLDAIVERRGPRAPESERASWLDRAFEQLQDCSSQPLTVRDLATTAGVHPVHVARAFRKYFRCTPGRMIHLRRLEKAAELLLFSRLPISEIATTSGFTDQSHMTTSFRRVYGATPGRFREGFVFTRRARRGRDRIAG